MKSVIKLLTPSTGISRYMAWLSQDRFQEQKQRFLSKSALLGIANWLLAEPSISGKSLRMTIATQAEKKVWLISNRLFDFTGWRSKKFNSIIIVSIVLHRQSKLIKSWLAFSSPLRWKTLATTHEQKYNPTLQRAFQMIC